VKVLVSESSIPLMVEADELPETVWFDGAHAAVRTLISQDSNSKPEGEFAGRDRINVDEVLPALQRLAAAYVIHLETEYTPPKEQWQRLTPLANALTESPLYVFHYLNKQARDGKLIGPDQVHRYVQYAETVFNPQEDKLMSHAKDLVEIYRNFYIVRKPYRASTYTLMRPIDIVADTLLNVNPDLFYDRDSLVEVARGQLRDRLASSETNAIVMKGAAAEGYMRQFCEKLIDDVFIGVFHGDVAALRGKQLNLLRSACETYYLDKYREELLSRKQADQSLDTDDELVDLPSA